MFHRLGLRVLLVGFVVGLMVGGTFASAPRASLAGAVSARPNVVASEPSFLKAASCFATSCWAVGYQETPEAGARTLVEHWNGTTSPSIVPSPSPYFVNTLSGVSCPSTTSCWAVGDAASRSASKALMEHWNGVSWSIVTIPSAGGLSSVSCANPTSCSAVGSAIEHWNGTRWSIEAGAVPPRSFDGGAAPIGVSCPSTTTCIAVGVADRANGQPGVWVEDWNGTSWKYVSSPDLHTSYSLLYSVTCARTTDCWAAGTELGKTPGLHPLLEHWNGTQWSLVNTPDASADLRGVKCRTTTDCVTVGFDQSTGTSRTVFEHWNGSEWTVVASPNSYDSTQLNGVSCTSTTSCFAVGWGNNWDDVGDREADAPVIEHWDGTTVS